MITPNFHQVTANYFTSNELVGKWWCSYQEEYKNEKFARYLGPKGWQYETYYWDSKPKMVSAFNFFGQIHLPVTPQEFIDTMDFRRDYERSMSNVDYDLYCADHDDRIYEHDDDYDY